MSANASGSTRHLRGEQRGNRHRRLGGLFQRGPVAPLIQVGELGVIEHVDRRQRPRRIGDHGRQHAFESLDQGFDVGRVEHIGVVLDTQSQFVTRNRLHRNGVMVVLAVREVRDGQSVGTRQRGGIDRIVLVDEERVEQVVLTGHPMNLVERQMLMIQGLGVIVLQLVEQTRQWWSSPRCWPGPAPC